MAVAQRTVLDSKVLNNFETLFGVETHSLKNHSDDRGVFTEIFREEWFSAESPVQWNVVSSHANVLRGLHVHKTHLDYLTVIEGEMLLALHDFRHSSPTFQQSCFMTLGSEDGCLVKIPSGVGHGFHFKKPAIHIYGVTSYFDMSDEYGCMWNDPDLNLNWPCESPKLSERDRQAGSYADLLKEFRIGSVQ